MTGEKVDPGNREVGSPAHWWAKSGLHTEPLTSFSTGRNFSLLTGSVWAFCSPSLTVGVRRLF